MKRSGGEDEQKELEKQPKPEMDGQRSEQGCFLRWFHQHTK
jgi:hypothetical protein